LMNTRKKQRSEPLANIGKVSMKNYYVILEVSADASQETIKRQYRFMANAWHPDKFSGPENKTKAEEKLKIINEAYEILGNPQKRSDYDKNRSTHTSDRGPREQASSHIFRLTLQPTYYRQGFFNVPIEHDRFVRSDEGPIKIIIGNDRVISGQINRSANLNRTARIFGGVELKRWFQRNFRPMDIVDINLGSFDEIRIDKT